MLPTYVYGITATKKHQEERRDSMIKTGYGQNKTNYQRQNKTQKPTFGGVVESVNPKFIKETSPLRKEAVEIIRNSYRDARKLNPSGKEASDIPKLPFSNNIYNSLNNLFFGTPERKRKDVKAIAENISRIASKMHNASLGRMLNTSPKDNVNVQIKRAKRMSNQARIIDHCNGGLAYIIKNAEPVVLVKKLVSREL